jgi:hypothetical protein
MSDNQQHVTGGSGERAIPWNLRQALLVAAATFACLLPFVDKAFHIDDHRYVQIGRQIHQDPFDFFGFDVVLGGSAQPEAQIANNPPLVGFFAALAALVTGWSETALHLAFLVPALAATLGTFALGRRLCPDPLLAALICLACPVFLLSATTVMAVVSMTALFCWSLWFWIRGLDRGDQASLAIGAFLAGLCALTKYFGIAVLPLLLAYSLVRERRLGIWSLHLLIPVALLVGFELYTLQVYDVSAILKTAGYSATTRTGGTGALERALVALVFAGGAFLPILFFAVIGFSGRMQLAALLLGAAAGLACFAQGGLAGLRFAGSDGLDWNYALHVVVFATAGCALFVLLAADLARRRDPDAVLLALWALGTFAFATVVNYTTNGRALVPMAPPLAILMARQLGERIGIRSLSIGWRFAPLAPALAIALLVAWGDAALADASRVAARRIAADHAARPGTLWFEGSWGFQHYMWEAGARAVDVRRNVLRPGDRLAGSDNGPRPLEVSARAATVVDEFEVPLPWITTMVRARGTGFYAIQWGPLPYRFAAGTSERFTVRRLDHLVIFEPDPDEIEQRAQAFHRSTATLATLLALHARAWPSPAHPGGADTAAAHSIGASCATQLPRLGARVSERCLWCSNEDQCRECIGAEAEAAGFESKCMDWLWATIADQLPRCRWELEASTPESQVVQRADRDASDEICDEAVGRWRQLLVGDRG